ncbi:MAG: alpha/beta fold hydrolase [Rhodoferax sp.]
MRRFPAFGVLLLATTLLASCGGADEPGSSSGSNGLPPPQTAVTNLSLLEPPGGKLRSNPAAAADLPLNATVLMDWAESVYSDLFAGAQPNQVFAPYIYRYYPATGNYLGVDGDKIYVLGPATGGVLSYVGRLGTFRCRIYPESCAAAPTVTLQFGVDNRIPVTAGAPAVTVPVSVFGAASSTPLRLELQGAPNFASVDGMQIVVNAVATPPIATKYEFTAVVRDTSSDEIVARVSGGVDVSVVGQAGQTREFVNGQSVPFSEFGISVLAGTNTFGSGRATVTVESVKQADGTDAIQITTSEPQAGDLVIAPIDSSSPSGMLGRRASAGSKIFAERQVGSRECVANDEKLESALSNGTCARVWAYKTQSVLCKGDINSRGRITTTLLRSGFQTGLTVARLVLDPTASSLNAIRLPSSICEGGTVTSIVSLQTWSQLYRPDVAITSDKVQPVLLINGYSVDVVGLGGGKSTWANTADLLGRSIADDGTQIVVWEFRWRTNTTFQQAAVDLTEAIERVYAASGNRKVALVAHSFGGLLARTALQRPAPHGNIAPKKVPEVGPLDDKVKSLVTIGTPHSGIASEVATFYESKFPVGSDNVGNNFCGQISCYQAGEQGRNKAPGEPMPGYVVAELSNLVRNPMPTGVERIYSLIGLKLGRPDLNPLNGTTYTQLEGDGLISYRGQRFNLADGAAEVHPALQLGYLRLSDQGRSDSWKKKFSVLSGNRHLV